MVPLTRTSTYSDVLHMALRFEARTKEKQVEREPHKKVKTRGQVFRQSEATGSGIAVGTCKHVFVRVGIVLTLDGVATNQVVEV